MQKKKKKWMKTSAEKVQFQPQQFPKGNVNIFAARLQSFFTNVPFYFWQDTGHDYIPYSEKT